MYELSYTYIFNIIYTINLYKILICKYGFVSTLLFHETTRFQLSMHLLVISVLIVTRALYEAFSPLSGWLEILLDPVWDAVTGNFSPNYKVPIRIALAHVCSGLSNITTHCSAF